MGAEELCSVDILSLTGTRVNRTRSWIRNRGGGVLDDMIQCAVSVLSLRISLAWMMGTLCAAKASLTKLALIRKDEACILYVGIGGGVFCGIRGAIV